jgi:hypothetical protein
MNPRLSHRVWFRCWCLLVGGLIKGRWMGVLHDTNTVIVDFHFHGEIVICNRKKRENYYSRNLQLTCELLRSSLHKHSLEISIALRLLVLIPGCINTLLRSST